MKNYLRTLTIAGSDSGGGAGIQADLKTFAALGCYGMSVLTALTAQNTQKVSAIHAVPTDFIAAQLDAILSDLGVDVIKIGMLHSPEVIETVATKIKEFGVSQLVIDPVMISKSGDHLLQAEAVSALKEELLPLALIITPNLPEAEALLERKISGNSVIDAARELLLQSGTEAVLLKGGHQAGIESTDWLISKHAEPVSFSASRVVTKNDHGTGCTLSAAIAAFLARGFPLPEAVTRSKKYLTEALIQGANYRIGEGHGPVHHFHHFWS